MKIKTILLIALLACIQVYAIQGDVSASILRYEPTPVEQGNTFDVWVQLSNSGTKADRVAVRFEQEYPFSLPTGQKEEIDVGVLAATESKVVKFTVFVDPKVSNADHDITFLYKYFSIDEWSVLESPITVQTQNAVLTIESYSVTPSPIVPGQPVKLVMSLKNSGNIPVKNLDVNLELDEKAFSTLGSGTKKRVDFIDIGDSTVIDFQLTSDTSTEIKIYSLPVNLTFQDIRGKEYSDTAKVSLVVNAQPELSLLVDSTDFVKKTAPGTVSLKLINKGIIDVKYASIKLIPTPDYEILSSSSESYVGNLDSDDFETIDFVIKPLVSDPQLSLVLEFKDPYNIDFRKQFDLPLRIITADELEAGGFPVGTVIVILLIGAGAYWWYFKKRKRR